MIKRLDQPSMPIILTKSDFSIDNFFKTTNHSDYSHYLSWFMEK